MPSLAEIERALAARQPEVISAQDKRQAGVAMVLHDGPKGPSVLFIERAQRDGDPWSGHMAFPGGRVDPTDADARAAAERETEEEVGLSLDTARYLGRLDDRQGNPRTHAALVISAFVYVLSEPPPGLVINHEVQRAFWFPVRELLEPARHVPYETRENLDFPGILVGEPGRHIVWGLTYSFLEGFFSVVGKPLPDRWTEELRSYTRRIER